jgi:outer membrane protein OmpA-like peptidoglycan-associated protein
MQPKTAPWNLNNQNVLILAGKHFESIAVRYGVCICPNELYLIPCKYIAIYSENTIRYVFEVIRPPLDNVTTENTQEINEILQNEKDTGKEWLKGMETCRMFIIKKIADVGPIINDYVSNKTNKLAPLTRGTPRYTTYEKIKRAKLTSQLDCVFDDEEEPEEIIPVKEQTPELKTPQKSYMPLIIISSILVVAIIIAYFIFTTKKPEPLPVKPPPVTKKAKPPSKFELEGNTFESGKTTIKDESLPILKNIASILKAYPETKIKIVGHTDNVGNEGKNIKLSGDRAKAVMDWFIENGISAERLSSEGKGSAQPVADNTAKEGRAKNRRTEILIISE